MPTRRQLLAAAAGALALGPVWAWFTAPGPSAAGQERFPVQKTDEQWRAALTSQQYRVLRRHATEAPYSSPLDREQRRGTFVCAGCGNELYAADTKYDSGTGWPSFWQPLPDAVGTSVDRSLLMVRTEVHCADCGGHLGHVFQDGPPPTGLRYCMNGAAMRFVPA